MITLCKFGESHLVVRLSLEKDFVDLDSHSLSGPAGGDTSQRGFVGAILAFCVLAAAYRGSIPHILLESSMNARKEIQYIAFFMHDTWDCEAWGNLNKHGMQE